jgi:hypothetical protein
MLTQVDCVTPGADSIQLAAESNIACRSPGFVQITHRKRSDGGDSAARGFSAPAFRKLAFAGEFTPETM